MSSTMIDIAHEDFYNLSEEKVNQLKLKLYPHSIIIYPKTTSTLNVLVKVTRYLYKTIVIGVSKASSGTTYTIDGNNFESLDDIKEKYISKIFKYSDMLQNSAHFYYDSEPTMKSVSELLRYKQKKSPNALVMYMSRADLAHIVFISRSNNMTTADIEITAQGLKYHDKLFSSLSSLISCILELPIGPDNLSKKRHSVC